MKRKIWNQLTTAVLTTAIGTTISIVGSAEVTLGKVTLGSSLSDLVATEQSKTELQINPTTETPSTTVDPRNNFVLSQSETNPEPNASETPIVQPTSPAEVEQKKPVQPTNNVVPVTRPQAIEAAETRPISNNNAAPAKKTQPQKINPTSGTPQPAAQTPRRSQTVASTKSRTTTRNRGMASWYGPGFHGRPTASGERFNQHGLTAAHRTLPIGTRVKVTNLNNGRSVVVRINDRGPFGGGRIIDLSKGAARLIGVVQSGVAPVLLEVLGR